MSAWVAALPGPVAVAYEAGPTGFGLARQLTAAGIRCVVAAPSKLQRPAGDRVKTDARDALHLARLLRLDEIVEVRVPSVEQEAARDLVRAREDVRGDLMRARHRVSKLLLRHGIVYSGGKAVDRAARRVAARAAFAAGRAAAGVRGRLRDGGADRAAAGTGWTRRSPAMAADSEFTPVVRRLCCLRGISTLTGFGLAVEIGDWHRFTGATHRRLPRAGAHRVTPPVASRSQGSITKTGNSHARRLLVEAAWHHRKPYRPRRDDAAPAGTWHRRRPGPAATQGNQRLHQRWAGVHRPQEAARVANVAIARELAGWCWSLAVLETRRTRRLSCAGHRCWSQREERPANEL